MYIQTRGNSNTVWLSSETGVINGTMTLSATPLEKILQAVNEKYGTSFESWSQLPTAYEVGDTVPNWNAYDKIEMPLNLSAIIMVYNGTGLAIDITNGAVGQIMCIDESPMQISSAKKYLHTGPPWADAENRAKTFIQQKYGVEITEWNANNVTVAINAEIPNSEKYIVLE